MRIRRAGFGLFRRATSARTDGHGYFGFTNVKPGRYRVWIDDGPNGSGQVEVSVEAGKVVRADVPRSRD